MSRLRLFNGFILQRTEQPTSLSASVWHESIKTTQEDNFSAIMAIFTAFFSGHSKMNLH